MKDNNVRGFSSRYLDQLKLIHNLNFTDREIDVIACLVSARGTSRIASFLQISPKTVVNHLRNIMVKLDCNSREGIIDFIEKSQKQSLFRMHYSHLIVDIAFNRSLKSIIKLTHELPAYSLIYSKEQEDNSLLLKKLKKYFEEAGIKLHLQIRSRELKIPQLIPEVKEGNYRIYLIKESGFGIGTTHSFQNTAQDPCQMYPNSLFLFTGNLGLDPLPHNLHGVECIDFTEKKNHYFAFFEILKKLLPQANLEKIIKEFKTQYEVSLESSETIVSEGIVNRKKNLTFSPSIRKLLKKRKGTLLIAFAILMSLLFSGFFILKEEKKQENTTADVTIKPIEAPIRSDLILPSATILLNRSELMEQIDHKFQGLKGIRTLAIIGIGGSGKTILARHYAHQQKESIIWEINAETKCSLNESFENLAYALSSTEDDQRALYALQEIKNSLEREKRLMEFVKMRLKLRSNWLLIYDNVENFKNIQKYFPLDVKTWGQGRAIITTRNTNIQNNRYMNHTLQIGELNENQKLDLLTKIMSQETKKSLDAAQTTKVRNFLAEIPSFPLDVLVASDYIKTTNVSYEQYLELIKNNHDTLTKVQEEILEESGEYTKTRYSLITLSLQKIIKENKGAVDLLLFISLLDSQNIPKNLFDLYKNSSTIDTFIYNLKKYSLVTTKLSPLSKAITFSIHRSTQAIILIYLTKMLNLREHKNNGLLQSFSNALGNSIEQSLDKEDLLTAKSLIRHLEAFLSHKSLLTNSIKGQLEGELGCIYTSLSLFEKSLHYFDNALLELSKDENQNYNKLAQNLLFQANSYVMLGSYRKAEIALKESIRIYKKYMPSNNEKLALGLVCLGNVYRWTGEYEKAKHLFQQSLNLYEKLPPQASIRKVMALISLGDLYRKLGDYKKATVEIKKSLAFCEEYLPKDSIQLAWTLVFSGVLHREFGRYKDAIDLINKSTAIYEKIFSKDSIFISDNLIDLSKAYYEMGQYAHAINLAENAILLFKKAKVNNLDFRCVEAMECLGNAYKGIKNYEKAKHHLKHALISYENHYGKNHLETAHLLKSLGHVYLLENNLKIAEEFLGKALDIFQKNKHPHEYKCLEDFSDLHLKKYAEITNNGKKKEEQYFIIQAKNDLKKALKIAKTHLPINSPHITRMQNKLKRLEYSGAAYGGFLERTVVVGTVFANSPLHRFFMCP